MNYIVIEGVKPWDGQYDFDLGAQPLTTREWGFIKRLTGYLPMTIDEAFKGADPELTCAFAAIALYRAGKITPADVTDVYEKLADAPFTDTIRFDGTAEDEDEESADPLPVEGSNGNAATSGHGSETSSETSASTPPGSGTPDWVSLGLPSTRSVT